MVVDDPKPWKEDTSGPSTLPCPLCGKMVSNLSAFADYGGPGLHGEAFGCPHCAFLLVLDGERSANYGSQEEPRYDLKLWLARAERQS